MSSEDQTQVSFTKWIVSPAIIGTFYWTSFYVAFSYTVDFSNSVISPLPTMAAEAWGILASFLGDWTG